LGAAIVFFRLYDGRSHIGLEVNDKRDMERLISGGVLNLTTLIVRQLWE
jgi:hypothetical protein